MQVDQRKNRSGIIIFLQLSRDALRELSRNDPLRMAGATAFFTTFALTPILLIIIWVLGFFIDPNQIGASLLQKLEEILGPIGVRQVKEVLTAVRSIHSSGWITAGGFVFLLFVATTLFRVIKSSLNQLWKIRVTGRKTVGHLLRGRAKAMAVIIIAGFLFVIGLLSETFQAFLGRNIGELFPTFAFYFQNLFNWLISIAIVTLWFVFLFRYLPDGRPGWTVALGGGFLTSMLFTFGKLAIRQLLSASNINTLYGASGSVVLLLLFVFYSSLILYFGAAFTKVWADHRNEPIRPLHHAVHYHLTEE
ncbi:MAG TPA: YihY/virulence factor BrkB family protein [Chitinophagaceae bacterium]|jgi:membrane protein|nr:YihY/virulence factor BrkB family protein [Chitinophagaceae bacterium]